LADEPAVAGDTVVPGVESWQQAADSGTAARAAASAVAGPAGLVAGPAGLVTGPAGARAAPAGARPPGPPWTPASAALPRPLRAELIGWLRGALPNEGCGLLVSDRVAEEGGVPTRFVGMRNAAASPYRYLMDPEEQLRVLLEIDDADEVVWGIVHSHVASPPYPSATDIGLAAYPDALYLLCSFASEPPELRAWTIVSGAVNEVVLERV
jgi:[CysO sulfur-carrier protein]-S-L-cysteine hydrolase